MTHDVEAVDLAGKVALVTSVAGESGLQIARMLAQSGAHVHIVSPDQRDCIAQMQELRRCGQVTGHAVDLQDGVALMYFADLIVEEVPKLNILISNARVARSERSMAMLDREILEKYDLLGDLCLAQELMPSLRDGSTAADPARVILLGDFEVLRTSGAPAKGESVRASAKSYSQGIAQRFMAQRINLNFVDAGRPGGDTSASAEEASLLLSHVLHFSSPATAHVWGEVALAL